MKTTKKILSWGMTLSLLLTLTTGCASAAAADAKPNFTATATETTAVQTAAVTGSTLTFSDSGISGSAAGAEIDGTSLTITAAGTYILQGSCEDGSVTVEKGVTGVTLVLNGLTLTSADTAPILCKKSTEVTIQAAAGTENTLTDSAKNNGDENPDNDNAENAVIKCKDGSAVTLCGSGTLNIRANGKNGIKSGASTQEDGESSLTIRELTLNIDAPQNDAVNAENLLNVESGNLTVSAGDDALHCDLDLNIGAENTQGPAITITACYEGLEGATVNIASGDISILSENDCINAANPDLTGYSYALNISGGTVTAYASSGDGFDSNGSLTISGGTVTVWTANTADNQPLDADGTVTISGGTVLAAGGSSGMGLKLQADQSCVLFSGSLDKGSSFSITDSQGSTLYEGTAPCRASFLLLSGENVTEGNTYSLTSGGSEAATAQAQTGTVSGGMGGMGGPGGNRGPGGDMGGQQPADGQFGGQRPTGGPGGEPPTGGPGDRKSNS